MMAALWTDIQVVFDLPSEQSLVAAGAFDEESFGANRSFTGVVQRVRAFLSFEPAHEFVGDRVRRLLTSALAEIGHFFRRCIALVDDSRQNEEEIG